LPVKFGGGSFQESLDTMPAQIKSLLGRGFKVLRSLPAESVRSLAREARESIGRTQEFDVSTIAKRLGLGDNEVADALSAAAFLTVVVVLEDVDVDSFIEDSIRAGVLAQGESVAIKALAQELVGNRDQLKTRIEQQDIANRVLPSFLAFDTTLEIRLDFKDDRVSSLVPVAIVHLDTDASHMEVWFQMSKDQVERLSSDLQALLKKIEQAETLIKGMKVS